MLSIRHMGLVCGTMVGLFVSYMGFNWIVDDLRQRRSPTRVRQPRKRRVWPVAARYPDRPDLADREAVHSFFVKELRLGESLLAAGDESAMTHLAYAVAVHENYGQLIACFRQVLPDDLFQVLIARLQKITPIYVDVS